MKDVLRHHQTASVNDRAIGWKNIGNGQLLTAMEGKFDLLIIADQNMYAQQNLSGRTISILVLPTNRRKDVLALGQRIAKVVGTLSAGQYAILEKSGTLSRMT